MRDVQKLIVNLHKNNIKVIIGVWANTGNRNNPFIEQNWQVLKPIIPTSDDVNPLTFITFKNKKIPFAEYVIHQYQKLAEDFEFDGLFLGDGFMGFRSFWEPDYHYDFYAFSDLWTDFYARIFQQLKNFNPSHTLWAYDVMGNGEKRAKKNGVDLVAINNFLDYYVFQSFGNDAWGKNYINLPGYSLERDYQQLLDIPQKLRTKTFYTAGIEDSVERWSGTLQSISEKNKLLSPHVAGALGVWSNMIIRNLLV